MWANSHLLFWLSLVPFATAWLGQSGGDKFPTALYGVSLLMPAVAYFLLQRAIIATHGMDSTLAKALGSDFKGKISPLLYVLSIALAFALPVISYLIFVGVAVLWIVPDQRIVRELKKEP